MNSALQVLLSCSGLNKLIVDTPVEGHLINTYRDLVIEYLNANEGDIITPREIKNTMSSMLKIFQGYGQQDAHEFISLLFRKISDEFKQSEKSEKSEKSELEIDLILGCKIRTEIKSIETDKISIKYDPRDVMLVLHIPEYGDAITLADCIRDFTSPERLDSLHKFDIVDKNNSSTYSVHEYAEKRIIIEDTGKYIMICLRRFKQINIGNYEKKNTRVTIPHTMKTTKGNYYLTSFIVQHGNRNSGHYISFVNDNNVWKCANDSSVSYVQDNNLNRLLEQAYIVCFERD
jgi:ubiquitin C-terminal hydrolase